MAGETQKSTALTNRDSKVYRESRLAAGNIKLAQDKHQFAAATELEAGDNLIMEIAIPSNSILVDIKAINDDLDTGTGTLVVDIGVAAREDYVSVTSSTETSHVKDDIIDATLFVDGDVTFATATAQWTSIALETTILAPGNNEKAIWELLGYDKDPRTTFNLVFQSQAAANALASAGDLEMRVYYVVD